MAIISFSKDTVIDYVPAYGGNRESPDPCVVRLRFVPYAKVQEYSRIIAARLKGTSDQTRASDAVAEVQKRQFIENVVEVSGFLVDGQEVKDASEFFNHATTDLIYEVLKAMEDSARLTEGQRKNSLPVSAGE